MWGCSHDIQTKEAVRQGVIDHLSSRKGLDLDLRSMDVDVSSVAFRANEADATVSFRARGSAASGADMQMRYTLERSGNRWVVKGKADSGGAHGTAPPPPAGASEMPPGHPPVSGGQR